VSVLETHGVSKSFGGVHALTDVSLAIGENEIVSVLGPNGSGKTTLFNIISGFMRPSTGTVSLNGVRIDRMRADQIALRGLVRTFQQTMVFPSMTVRENMDIARRLGGYSPERASELLATCGLGDMPNQRSDQLSYGSQKRLGVAMAIATGARVLLLDEPGAGLGATEASALAVQIQDARRDGRTVVIIDHDMGFVLPLSDRVVVLDVGRIIFEGSPADVVHDELVVSVYLGA
jgi:branched-chain amino acid transport system ATP-binding protein